MDLVTIFRIARGALAVRLFGSREVNIDSVRDDGRFVVCEVSGSDVPKDCAEIAVVTEQNTHIVRAAGSCDHHVISVMSDTEGQCDNCDCLIPLNTVIYKSGRKFHWQPGDPKNRSSVHPAIIGWPEVSAGVWKEP